MQACCTGGMTLGVSASLTPSSKPAGLATKVRVRTLWSRYGTLPAKRERQIDMRRKGTFESAAIAKYAEPSQLFILTTMYKTPPHQYQLSG